MTALDQPLLGDAPEGMPDPELTPPQVARAGDPFASLRVVVGLSRLSRNVTHQLRDVVAAINAAYVDWLFDEAVVLSEVVQLQSNWSISFHGEDRIVLGENERGRTLLIVGLDQDDALPRIPGAAPGRSLSRGAAGICAGRQQLLIDVAKPIRFTARLESEPNGGRFVVIPLDLKALFGEHRPALRATVNGYTFRTRGLRYGGRYLLGFTREVRQAAGIADQEEITVDIQADTEPRTVTLPPELATAFAASPEARAFYDGLAFTHRREYAEWVGDAKKAETRVRRAATAVERLVAGLRDPT